MIVSTSSVYARIAPPFSAARGAYDFNEKLKVVAVIFFEELCKLGGLTFPQL